MLVTEFVEQLCEAKGRRMAGAFQARHSKASQRAAEAKIIEISWHERVMRSIMVRLPTPTFSLPPCRKRQGVLMQTLARRLEDRMPVAVR